MKKLFGQFCVLAVAAMAAGGSLTAQGGKPSPASTADLELKGKKIEIAYARPSMRHRKIMGGLVPYGEVWRTGANEATSLKTPVDLEIGGSKVPAGSYTLYTLPGADSWKLIVNKQTGQWGTDYDQSKDLVRVNLTVSATAGPVEQFTISFDKKNGDSANLVMEWENTRLTVPVKVR